MLRMLGQSVPRQEAPLCGAPYHPTLIPRHAKFISIRTESQVVVLIPTIDRSWRSRKVSAPKPLIAAGHTLLFLHTWHSKIKTIL
jgi:hypothetical protein